MRLQRITATGAGLKGQTFSAQLTGVDVFVGPNGAGKSTRLLAVLAGLRGLAETPSDSAREYLGPVLPTATVDLDFERARISRFLGDSHRTASARKADGIAEEVAGAHLVRWDLADLAAAAPSDRAKLLQRVCDLAADAWARDRLVAELRERLAPVAIEEGAEPPATIRLLEELVAELASAAGGATTPSKWLAAALEWAKQEFTAANAAKRQAAATVDGLAAEIAAARGEELPSATALAAEIERLETEQRTLEQQRRDAQQRADARSRAERDLAAAQQQLATARRDVSAAGELPAERPDVQRLRAEAQQAAEEEREARSAVMRASKRAASLKGRLDALSQPQRPCAHCGHSDPGGVGTALEEARQEFTAAQEELEDAEADLDAAALVLGARNRGVNEAQWVLARIEGAERAARALATAEADVARRAEEVAALPHLAFDGAARLQEITPRLNQLRQQRDRALRAAERDRLYHRAVADQAAASERFDAVSRLGSELKQLRERVTAEAFAPLEREATAIVEPVLGGRVEFRSGADFGLARGELYVPWWSLSDGERAVVGAGIAYAFARVGRAKWRAVILDGAEAIDAGRLETLLRELGRRVQLGDLDNALVAVRTEEDGDGWVNGDGIAVHRLEAPAQGAVEAA
ncbi:MAG TPA: hypothetical protein VEB22_15230 [Phycisphaerales bacterium]|nr:hypothetical protein [Phycisphaerales bacterium]